MLAASAIVATVSVVDMMGQSAFVPMISVPKVTIVKSTLLTLTSNVVTAPLKMTPSTSKGR